MSNDASAIMASRIRELSAEIEQVKERRAALDFACQVADRQAENKAQVLLFDTVIIYLYAESMEDVAKVLRELAVGGYQQTAKPYDCGKARIYTCGPIGVYITFDSIAKCQFVKVGERLEPVYEIKCE